MFGGAGVDMHEAQIDLKKTLNRKNTLNWGGGFLNWGVYTPTLGGV